MRSPWWGVLAGVAFLTACGARRGLAVDDRTTRLPMADLPMVMATAPNGCADGTREAFQSTTRYPRIAGCAGGFTRPGVFPPGPPTCGHRAGNTGPNPAGEGGSAG